MATPFAPGNPEAAMSRTRHSMPLGLIAIAGSLVLSLVVFALPVVWSTILNSGIIDPPLFAPIHAFWIPLVGLLVDVSIVILGLIGFSLLWRGRWEIGPDYASRAGLGLLTLVVALVAYAAYLLTGTLLGFVRGVAFLAPWHDLFAFAGSVFLGFTLYWFLANLPVNGSNAAAAVAFALGVAGAVLLIAGTLGVRRAEGAAVQGAGTALSLASLVLWLVLCVWDSQGLRRRGAIPRAAGVPRDT